MCHRQASRLALELDLVQAMYPGQIQYESASQELKFAQGPSVLHLRVPEHYPDAGVPDVISASNAARADLRACINNAHGGAPACCVDEPSTRPKTVIIWLHHLLNTNKRKLALSPPPSAPPVFGLTKPGYPGVLVYSGPAAAVMDHVNALKAENWQAFQIRYEADEMWTLAHGSGVREVESMSDLVKAVEGRAEHKVQFLEAVGIK